MEIRNKRADFHDRPCTISADRSDQWSHIDFERFRISIGGMVPVYSLLRDPIHVRQAENTDDYRVGGGLAAPVLPHHRTCGSASGGSPRKLKCSQLVLQ